MRYVATRPWRRVNGLFNLEEVRQRARSAEDKAQRSEDLLDAAEELALELGGVRFVTVAPITDRAGLHRTGVRRYYATKEELLIKLAERGWQQWRDVILAATEGQAGLDPSDTAQLVSETLISLPVFCDLITHVPLHLEGDVGTERAREYKTNAFAAYDVILGALDEASAMSLEQLTTLLEAALPIAGWFWQLAHPTPQLAALYEEVPAWGHSQQDFERKLTYLLQQQAIGITVSSTAGLAAL